MKKRIIWWILIIIWCAFIFYESSNNGTNSGKQSAFIIKIIDDFLSNVFGSKFHLSEYFIRKCAHFSEYLILGCLIFKGFYMDKLGKAFVLSAVIGVIYAASDEIHQSFIPGRAPRIFDVSIDTLGLIVGIIILSLFALRAENRRKMMETGDDSGKV